MSVQFAQHYRFTVHDYYRMAEEGLIRPDARVELIDGEIVEMSPIGSRHASHVRRLHALLQEKLGSAVMLSIQSPLRLSDIAEPEPDIVLLRPRDDFYADAHPTPDDALLVIEVGDSSVSYDRNEKAPLYARHGVREYWLLDLVRNVVTVYTQPEAGMYKRVEERRGEDLWTSHSLPDLSLSIGEILS